MPYRDEILEKKTYKEPGMEVGRRVFCTLTDIKNLDVHRTAKALALLVEQLNEHGILDENAIDELLLETIS